MRDPVNKRKTEAKYRKTDKFKRWYNEYKKTYYNSDKHKEYRRLPRVIEARKKHNSTARSKNRAWLDKIKLASGCIDCGYNRWAEALDFDHRNMDEKKIGIARIYMCSKERILEEIAKCDIRCANCHRHKTLMDRLLKKSKLVLIGYG